MDGLSDGTGSAGLSLKVGTVVGTGAGTLAGTLAGILTGTLAGIWAATLAGISGPSGIFRVEIVILNFSFGRLNTVTHVSRNKSVTILGPGKPRLMRLNW